MEIYRYNDNNNYNYTNKCKLCGKSFNTSNYYVSCVECYNKEKEKLLKHQDFNDIRDNKEYYYYYCIDCNDYFCNIHIKGYDDYPIYRCPICGVLCNSIKLDFKPNIINNILEV